MTDTKPAEADVLAMEPYDTGGAVATTGEGGLSMLDMDPEAAVKLVRLRAEQHKTVRGIVLSQIVGKDCWIDQNGKPYLEGRGGSAALQFIGLSQANRAFEWYEDQTTSERVCACSFEVVDGQGQVKWRGVGQRAFDSSMKSERNVKLAAEKNGWHHAACDILGIGGWSWKQLEEFDIHPATTINYDAGSKGGKGARDSATGELVLRISKSKGRPVSKADTSDLVWIEGVTRANIDNPDKARYVEANKALLAAVTRELETRQGS